MGIYTNGAQIVLLLEQQEDKLKNVHVVNNFINVNYAVMQLK
jgi:hypothetical protein